MNSKPLIEAAASAPSSHNTQPWLFRVHDDVIELWADRTRALSVNDPFDRELTISCGAALFNLRAAAAAQAAPTTVSYPEAREDLLATVRLGAGALETSVASLAEQIGVRFTTRDAFESDALPSGLVESLHEAVAAEGARLHVLEGDDRAFAAELIAEGDRAQFANPNWRRELASWMHPRRADDGLAMSPWVAPISRLVVRNFDIGSKVGRDDEELAVDAPALVMISTANDDPMSWLRAGQALQRALLFASAEGVQAGYLNQPCQLEDLRARLASAVCPERFPQVLFRLGSAAQPSHRAPRRAVDEVVIET